MSQPGADRSGLPVEFGIGDVEFFILTIDKKGESPVMRAIGGPLPEQIDNRGRRSLQREQSGSRQEGPPNRHRQQGQADCCQATKFSVGSVQWPALASVRHGVPHLFPGNLSRAKGDASSVARHTFR